MRAATFSGGYKVDVTRGERVGRVSSEWFSRPDDERFLSLGELARSVRGRSERSRTRVVESALIHVEANRTDPERLALILPGADARLSRPTHWAFGQLASIVGAPASYLRQLPAPLAGINLQYGLTNHRAEQVKTFETEDGRTELRAVTGPDYGRIHDHELVEAVQRIAGNGTGDTRWKVPGVLDWSTGVYNPDVEISRDTTTLYASDRDVFLFLVDDHNPIEAGRLPDGSPDLYFRGFYCWNSEVGAKTLGMASFYLRAVCQNRNLWGVEDFQEITIRHSKYAASRFAHEAAPALTRFANSSPQGFVNGIKAARQQIVARTDEDRDDFLRKRGFSKAESGKIIEKVLMEEGRPPEKHLRFRAGHHAACARQDPARCAPRHGRARQEAPRSSCLIPAKPGMRFSVSPALRFRAFPVRRSVALPPLEEEGGASLRDGLEVERECLGRPSRSKSRCLLPFRKSSLSSSRDIPFNKLVLSQSNVRRVKAGVSIEELAEDIARRGLLQGLSVCPAGRRRRRRRDRHVRDPGRRPPLPRPRAAGKVQADGPGSAGSLRGARSGHRRRGFAC
jgi:hypothetical protein